MGSKDPWRSKADIPSISREDIQTVLSLSFPSISTFEFVPLEGGVINLVFKIFNITSKEDGSNEGNKNAIPDLVLKVINPQYDSSKAANEITIMKFLSHYLVSTGLLKCCYIPRIIQCDIEGKLLKNRLNYILMEFIEGKTLRDIELDSYEPEKRYYLLDQLAEFYAAMKCFTCFPQKIGCFEEFKILNPENPFFVQVSLISDIDTLIPPVDSFRDYFLQCLKSRCKHAVYKIDTSKTDSDKTFYQQALKCLQSILKKVEDSDLLGDISWGGEDRLCICHTDLNNSNIIVDPGTLQIKGILDWEWSCLGTFEMEETNLELIDKWGRDYFMEKVLQKWNEIRVAYPQSNPLGNIKPESSSSNYYKRKFWIKVNYFAIYCVCMQNWGVEDWELEKQNLLKDGEIYLEKILKM
eukprot:TRINITY_DN982_c0_g1_i4.p1 TRINITY_DN982_c0_g1~~TRINITY_DN982_c0_g1_i4.p1  ORF type:complete len:410 (-),score=84.75 TRINITY_DN982_c0_g1_i4:1264-2493(-)